jgi:hypothetical protein
VALLARHRQKRRIVLAGREAGPLVGRFVEQFQA